MDCCLPVCEAYSTRVFARTISGTCAACPMLMNGICGLLLTGRVCLQWAFFISYLHGHDMVNAFHQESRLAGPQVPTSSAGLDSQLTNCCI